MKTTLTVTDRGTITLPAKLRQQLGIKADDQLIAEATPEGLLLRPAVTLPVEIYSDFVVFWNCCWATATLFARTVTSRRTHAEISR